MSFFSIFIPFLSNATLNGETFQKDQVYIYASMLEALKCLRGHKEARLKIFDNCEDAIKYSQTGIEDENSKCCSLQSPIIINEKVSYRSPTKRELKQFRKAIECDRYGKVYEMIWENPRYLINSGDTPTSLRDGCRYNAIHIASIYKTARITKLILCTIDTVEFIALLHGRQNIKICQEVRKILLDYYLNMPEKVHCETPLHLAARYGAVEVVEVLTSYPQCKRMFNVQNHRPEDIICCAVPNSSENLKKHIYTLLQERYYVPVIRSVDNSLPPTIGKPFSPAKPPDLKTDIVSAKLEIRAYAGPMSEDQAMHFRRRWKTTPRMKICPAPNKNVNCFNFNSSNSSPTKFTVNNVSPFDRKSEHKLPYKIATGYNNRQASSNRRVHFAKPPSPLNTAENFQYQSNSLSGGASYYDNKPQRLGKRQSTETYDFHYHNTEEFRAVDRFDFNVRSTTNTENKRPLQNSISFSANQNERFMMGYRHRDHQPFKFDFNGGAGGGGVTGAMGRGDGSVYALSERHVKLRDPEKGLEQIGRDLAYENNYGWREYWDFLGCFANFAATEGLEKLECFLQYRAEGRANEVHYLSRQRHFGDEMNSLCAAFKNTDFINNTGTKQLDKNVENYLLINMIKPDPRISPRLPPKTATPYLCLEKSFQIFAKRCIKTILCNLDSSPTIDECIIIELKRLTLLIYSFKDDNRFMNIDLSVAHSRFANLMYIFIRETDDIKKRTVQKIRKNLQVFLEHEVPLRDRDLTLQCVAIKLLQFLKEKNSHIQPESLKIEKTCLEAWMRELKCSCPWNSPSKRSNNRRRRCEINEVSNALAAHTLQMEQLALLDPDGCKSTNNLVCSAPRATFNGTTIEEERFLSGVSGNDRYFTTPCALPSMQDFAAGYDPNIFIYGNRPTKRDIDVFNALQRVLISKELYPYVHRWHSNILQYPIAERANFPTPSTVFKNLFKNPQQLPKPKKYSTSGGGAYPREKDERNSNNRPSRASQPSRHQFQLGYTRRPIMTRPPTPGNSPLDTTNLSQMNISDHF